MVLGLDEPSSKDGDDGESSFLSSDSDDTKKDVDLGQSCTERRVVSGILNTILRTSKRKNINAFC